jgi:cystathionine beta-lyase/cystathionine gamma-synthase
MTAPDEILAADIRRVMQAVSIVTGLKGTDIVHGSGRAAGHVSARHAVFFLLRQRGHPITAIAHAFGHTRTGVQSILKRVGIHGRVWDVIERARESLKKPADFRK